MGAIITELAAARPMHRAQQMQFHSRMAGAKRRMPRRPAQAGCTMARFALPSPHFTTPDPTMSAAFQP
ncbi:hypothetical protein, partial [Chitinimonas sp.]|uniref:hypothetical protein n=1 Tax=Chitinimonas sp. TaxID=1934313 RepID=UPI0035AECDF0